VEQLAIEMSLKKTRGARRPLAACPSDEKPRLQDLIDCASLQSMLDDLTRLTGLTVAIVDLHGELLVISGWQDICSEFHRKSPGTLENCRLSDTVLSQAGEPGVCKPYRCANGMLDVSTPIRVNGQHVGNLFFGQFFLEGEEPDREEFRLRARRFGLDEEAYLAALDRVPRRTKATVDAAMAFYAKFAEMISSLGHTNVALTRTARKAQKALEAQQRDQRELAKLQQRECARSATLQTVNEVVGKLVSEKDGVAICRMIGEAVHRVVPRAIVIASYVAPDGKSLKMAAIESRSTYLAAARKLLGIDPNSLEIPMTAYPPDESAWLHSGKLQHFPGGLFALTGGSLPESVCHALERVLGIAETCSVGLAWEGCHFGGLSLLLPRGVDIGEHVEAIELIVRQASIALQRAASDRALASSEAQLRTLVETIPDLVWLKDPQGVFRACNLEFERLYGAAEAEIVGKTDYDFVEAAEADFFRQKDREAMTAGTPTVNQEWVTYAEDGRRALLETIKTPMRDANGELTGVLGVARDITEHKRTEKELRDSENRLRITFDRAPMGASITGVDFRFQEVNEAMCDFLGYTPEELTGRSFRDVTHPDDVEVDRSGLEAMLAGTSDLHSRDKRYVRKDGAVVWGHLTVRLVRDESGLPMYFLGIIEDINERRRAEEAERAAVQTVTRALDATVVAMGALAEMRDPYTAGHERRVTQLAVAVGEKLGLAGSSLAALRLASSVHDIGKIGVPAEILSKPGRLTELEFEIVMRHPQVGYDILNGVDFGMPVAEIVLTHHERLDGSGYPRQLTDGEIPPEARILAVADVVEAMASHRPYRAALGLDAALDEIMRGRGRLYDPDVVDACRDLFRGGSFDFED
jgi:PAS domain S-box-containing protein